MGGKLKSILMWLPIVVLLGAGWLYLSRRDKPMPAPPAKSVWLLTKYDSGNFYLMGNDGMDYKATCESEDCSPLLDALPSFGGGLTAQRNGLHLVVTQNGRVYHLKIVAMGLGIDKDEVQGSGEK